MKRQRLGTAATAAIAIHSDSSTSSSDSSNHEAAFNKLNNNNNNKKEVPRAIGISKTTSHVATGYRRLQNGHGASSSMEKGGLRNQNTVTTTAKSLPRKETNKNERQQNHKNRNRNDKQEANDDEDDDIIQEIAKQKADKIPIPTGIACPSQLVWYLRRRRRREKNSSTNGDIPRYYPCRVVKRDTEDIIYQQYQQQQQQQRNHGTSSTTLGWDESTHALVQVLEYPPSCPFKNGTSDCMVVERSCLLAFHGGAISTTDSESSSKQEQQQLQTKTSWSIKLWGKYVKQRQLDLARQKTTSNINNNSKNNNTNDAVVTPTDIQAGYYYLQRLLQVALAGGQENSRHFSTNGKKGNDEMEVDVGDLDVPYSLNFSDDEEYAPPRVLTMASLLERQREPLRPGDVILYTHPIFVDGDKRGERRATVLSTDPDRRPMIYLDNGDVLPDDNMVARIQTPCRQTGQLLDHPGVFRPIEDFRMQRQQVATSDGKTVDAAEGIRRQAKRMKRIMQQGKRELMELARNGNLLPSTPDPTATTPVARPKPLKRTSTPTNGTRKALPALSKSETNYTSFHLEKQPPLVVSAKAAGAKTGRAAATKAFPKSIASSNQLPRETTTTFLKSKPSIPPNDAKTTKANRSILPPNQTRVTKSPPSLNPHLSISLSDTSSSDSSSSDSSSSSSSSSSPSSSSDSSKDLILSKDDRRRMVSPRPTKIAQKKNHTRLFDSDSSDSEGDCDTTMMMNARMRCETPKVLSSLRRQPCVDDSSTASNRGNAKESPQRSTAKENETKANLTPARSAFARSKISVKHSDSGVLDLIAPNLSHSRFGKPIMSAASPSNRLLLTKWRPNSARPSPNSTSAMAGSDATPTLESSSKPRAFKNNAEVRSDFHEGIDLSNTPSDEDDDDGNGCNMGGRPRKEGLKLSSSYVVSSTIVGTKRPRKSFKKKHCESMESDAFNVDEEGDLFDTESSSSEKRRSNHAKSNRKRRYVKNVASNDHGKSRSRQDRKSYDSSARCSLSGQLQIREISPRSRRRFQDDDW